jgi:hypothetical protein
MTAVVSIHEYRRKAPYLNFTRAELHRLLSLYSSRVMRGEWRDYAISHGATMASFFIFRHSRENPLFVISKLETRGKDRVAAAKQGRYVLFGGHKKLKQAHDLEDLLKAFNQPLTLVTA